MNEYDVAVVGGGSAGIAAALAAARTGAHTLLIERHGYTGGAGTASLVHTLCGLYHPDTSQPPQYVNGGIAAEFAEALGGTPVLMGKVYVLPHHPSHFANVADQLLNAEPSLDLWFHAECGSITKSDNHWKLEVLGRPSSHHITTHTLVDTSGDATVAERINAEREIIEPSRLFRPAYIVTLNGLDPSALEDDGRLQLAGTIARAISNGQLSRTLAGTSFRPSPSPGEAFVTIDLELGEGNWNPDSPQQMAEVETTGRNAAWELTNFLKANHPAFANIGAPGLPARAGIRESWRWVGEARVEADDILSSRRREDEIALGSWPMELRENAKGPKLRYPTAPLPFGIPIGALIPRNQERLFTAGRCLSSSHEALASLRVMGTALATGHAAGYAAALTAKSPTATPPNPAEIIAQTKAL